MGLFERAEIRALSEKLLALAAGQGILLNSVAGRELDDMLGRVGGVQPVGRSARRQLTERGRAFLTTKLAQAAGEQPWSGEAALAALGCQLPAAINGATLSGLWLRDCKAALSPSQLARVAELGCQVLADEVIRLRTLTPLRLIDKEGSPQDMMPVISLLGELALSERALSRLRGVEWQGRQIVTVENKGAFVDYPLQPGELLLYVPGRNTALAKRVMPLLSEAIPWAHFGDLDQRGLEIAAELAHAIARPLALWLPGNLTDYLPHYARPLSRPSAEQQSKIPWLSDVCERASGSALAEVLNHLVVNKCWLEQEVLVTARHWQSWPLG
ncbi:Wadjet anti-phage system protein JetD domain-containing protein [Aeromonas media]|nr:Wadjet anti-phage system protein JetD domain-containing protein [Aeromonas media]